MLRIDQCPESTGAIRVRLSGHLTGPWVHELDAACRLIPSPPSANTLDLTELVFADLDGQQLLRRLRGAGFRLEGLSPFLAAQLGMEVKAPPGHA